MPKIDWVEAASPLVNKSPEELKFEIEDNVYYKQETAPGIWEDTDKQRICVFSGWPGKWTRVSRL